MKIKMRNREERGRDVNSTAEINEARMECDRRG